LNQQIIQSVLEKVSKGYTDQQNLQYPSPLVPIAVSARHCHLSKDSLEKLFGEGYELTKRSFLSQPGQYASNETVTIVGPRGTIENVRILGPTRSLTQVEVSKTDSIRLGLDPPLRQSGDIEGSSQIKIVGPKGSIFLPKGLIIAQAHIHMSPDDAIEFKVEDKEIVKVKSKSKRPIVFEEVLIRVSSGYSLEMHIDTDEANAALVGDNQSGTLIKYTESNDLL